MTAQTIRLGAVDIGTNSIRCIVVEGDGRGEYRVLDDEKAVVRLGEKLARDGVISPEARHRAIEAIGQMKGIMEGFGVKAVEAVATSAMRKATNGPDLLQEMSARLGGPIRIISGEDEGELALLSATRHFDIPSRYALADIGGGSVELVLAAGRHIEKVFSLELGAIVLTERFLASDPVSEQDMKALHQYVREELGRVLLEKEQGLYCLIGSGGTMTTIGSMVMARRGERYESVHRYEVLRSEVVHLLSSLQRKSIDERKGLAGLNPDRADIILAGVVVADALMECLEINTLKINSQGIREGLIIKGLQKLGPGPGEPPRDWLSCVRSFSRSCLSEEEHSEQVAAVALQIFDALESRFPEEGARRMLHAACLLHDIGYFIGYSKHHKHSYHLICHADLFSFTPREREIVANAARYHRKSLPSKKHDNLSRLSPDDRNLAIRLGALVRLADGLDRRRSAAIRSVQVRMDEQFCLLGLQGEGDLSVEIHGGQKKGDLFEAAFQCRLDLRQL